jgi:hypothetical protein
LSTVGEGRIEAALSRLPAVLRAGAVELARAERELEK